MIGIWTCCHHWWNCINLAVEHLGNCLYRAFGLKRVLHAPIYVITTHRTYAWLSCCFVLDLAIPFKSTLLLLNSKMIYFILCIFVYLYYLHVFYTCNHRIHVYSQKSHLQCTNAKSKSWIENNKQKIRSHEYMMDLQCVLSVLSYLHTWLCCCNNKKIYL